MATSEEDRFNKWFRENLRADRERLGYTQEKMAFLLGISKANYQKYETRSAFPLYLLGKLSLLTNKSPGELVSR